MKIEEFELYYGDEAYKAVDKETNRQRYFVKVKSVPTIKEWIDCFDRYKLLSKLNKLNECKIYLFEDTYSYRKYFITTDAKCRDIKRDNEYCPMLCEVTLRKDQLEQDTDNDIAFYYISRFIHIIEDRIKYKEKLIRSKTT